MRISARIRRRAGYSMIELVIVMGISSIVMLGLMALMVSSHRTSIHQFNHNLVQEEARRVADVLAADVRGAIQPEASFVSGGVTYTQSTTTLILRMPGIDANGRAIDQDPATASKFDRIIYDSTGNTLVRRIRPDSTTTTSRVTENRVIGIGLSPEVNVMGAYLVKPDALGAHVIHYQFMAEQKFIGKVFRKPVSGSVRLRNK